MTDNELLLAISDLLDTKLKAELQPLKNDLQDQMQAMRDELHAVEHGLLAEIQDVRAELHAAEHKLHVEIQDVRTELHAVEHGLLAEIQDVRAELHAVEHGLHVEIQSVQTQLHLLQLNQETVIMPRLNTIEACYTDTYKRYRDNADKIEATFEDVDLLKKVVAEHSQRLQRLA